MERMNDHKATESLLRQISKPYIADILLILYILTPYDFKDLHAMYLHRQLLGCSSSRLTMP